jgi:hypothetical protein
MRTNWTFITAFLIVTGGLALQPATERIHSDAAGIESAADTAIPAHRYAQTRWTRVGDVLGVKGAAEDVYVRLIVIEGEIPIGDHVDEAELVRRISR